MYVRIIISKTLKSEGSQEQDNVSEQQEQKIQKILSTRGQQVFLSYISKKINMDEQAVDNIMELLTNEGKYEGLLNELSKVKNIQNPEDIQAIISFINESKDIQGTFEALDYFLYKIQKNVVICKKI